MTVIIFLYIESSFIGVFLGRLYFGPYGMLSPEIYTYPTAPKLYFHSDLGRRAASSWALPHISSYFYISAFCMLFTILSAHLVHA